MGHGLARKWANTPVWPLAGPRRLLLYGGMRRSVHIRAWCRGWWYLLGGNNAQLDERYVTLSTSPVQRPQQGAMVRLSDASCQVRIAL